MNIKDIVGMLPENARAEAEKVIGDAVAAGNVLAGIDTQEKAFELIKKTAILKSAFDAEISKTVENHDKKFMEEKLPKLVDAEVKKLTGPETDPIKIELAQIKAERAAEKAEAQRAKQLAVAMKIAAEEKIPVDDIERFISEDDDRTVASVKAYAARIKAWNGSQIESTLKERLGNNGRPNNGVTAPANRMQELNGKYAELMTAKRFPEAMIVQAEIAKLGETNG